VQVPWFIGFFVLASAVRSFVPWMAGVSPALGRVATTGLTLTLFLIGRGAVGENAARGWLATVLAGRPSLALYQRRLTCGNHPSCLT